MVTLNDQYKMAIGALELETVPVNIDCVCDYYDLGDFIGTNTIAIDFESECFQYFEPDASCYVLASYTTNRIEHPSDGVVLASSAGNMPGGIVRPGLDRMMEKTSHQQMRNNSELEVKLTNLFAGGVDFFFKIEPR